MCNNIDKIDEEKLKSKLKTYLNLHTYTNKTIIKFNNECMERFIKTRKFLFNYIPMEAKCKIICGNARRSFIYTNKKFIIE